MTYNKTLEDLLEALGFRESSGNYSAVNNYGYLGKYQMGEAALADTGYYKGSSPGYIQQWKGQFTGKDNVYSKNDYLNNQQAQENAIREYMKKQWQILQGNGATKHIGSKINDIEITPSGLLAMSHLKGSGYVGKYLNQEAKIEADGNGTSPLEYLKKFGGYDVTKITNPEYYEPNFTGKKEDYVGKVASRGRDVIAQTASQVMPTAPIPNSVLKKTQTPPPLTDAEWYKRLFRQRMGIE